MSDKCISVSREVSLRRRKTISGYQYRRRSKALCTEQYSAELKHVLGLTLKTNCAFSCDPNTGLLAYPAGCVIVLFNPQQGKQTHIFNPEQKTLTCLKFSEDGHFIVTGEAGHRPCVRIFSVADRCQVASFSSHKFGISCVAFSPNGKYVTSIGFQHDNVINVWDWKKNKLAASNKVSTKIKAVAFARDSSHFITVGNRLVKYWYLEEPSDPNTVPLKGRSAILETLRNHVFCDVVCGNPFDQYAYAITRSGILCKLNCGRTVAKHVELKCDGGGRSICAIGDMILCSCSDGSVHVYNADSLEFVTIIFPLERLRGTEIIATAIDFCNMWLHCVFADHSFVVNDVVDLISPKIHALHQFHGGCVWDVKVLPNTSECESLPKDCFLTCSSDGSARVWQSDGNVCKLLKIVKLHKGIEDGDNNSSSSKLEARSLCIRSDGKHLAIGDRSGNVHVYNLETFEKITFILAHEGDVLCMDYSQNGDMLASASRDRCVHTFDSRYNPTHTIADHSAAVTSVNFAQNDNDFRLITCGSDKSLYFCSITNNNGKTEIAREQHFVEKHSMSDMAVLDDSVLLACGCNLSEYDIIGGKLRRTFRGNEATAGILRVAVNGHRTLVATSCVDKHIYLLNFATGDCLSVLSGHSEMAMALAFDAEDHLLSASADGCVFMWTLIRRVPDDFRNLQVHSNPNSNVSTPESPDVNRMEYFVDAKPVPESRDETTPKTMNGESFSTMLINADSSEDLKTDAFQAAQVNSIFSADHSELPTWVTKSISNENYNSADSTPRLPFGKWGHRSEAEKICEELGNLPLSLDLTSMKGSIDENSDIDEDNRSITTEDESSSGQLTVEECSREKPSTSSVKEQEAPKEPQSNAVSNDEMVSSDDAASIITHHHMLDPVLLPSTELAGFHMDDATSMEVKIDAQELSGDLLENDIKSVTIDEPEINSENLDRCEENSPNAVNDNIDRPNVINYAKTPLEQSNSIATTQEEGESKSRENSTIPASSSDTNVVLQNPKISSIPEPKTNATTIFSDQLLFDEDIDVRSHYFKSKNLLQNQSESVQTLPQTRKAEHEMHSTPQSHFTASVSIKLSSPPRSKQVLKESSSEMVSEQKSAEDLMPQEIVAAADVASKTLVDQVLLECNESVIEDFDPQSDDQNLLILKTIRENESDAKSLAIDEKSASDEDNTNSTVKEIFSTAPDIVSTTSQAEVKEEEIPSNPCTSIKEQFENKSGTSNAEETKAERPASMPPAFAEFIANLTKKKPLNHPTNQSSYTKNGHFRQNGTGMASKNRPQYPAPSPRSAAEVYGDERRLNGVDNRSRSSSRSSTSRTHPVDHRTSDDEIDECQKVGDDLMNLFNHAVALYRKRQVLQNSEKGLSNGTLEGYNRLMRTFQIMHSRISRLEPNMTDLDPNPTPRQFALSSRSMSLDNVGDDSPVVSLLREYSDKLVGLVHDQVDNKIYSTPADTV